MMEDNIKSMITVEATVHVPVKKAWELWTEDAHIVKWNHASDDWHTTKAVNNLIPEGIFNYRMEAKDGSFGFDFCGIYDKVIEAELLAYTIEDGRKVTIHFTAESGSTVIIETFEAEHVNSAEIQRDGWQSILNNFKKYAENTP